VAPRLAPLPSTFLVELYATAFVAEKLTEWGYEVHMGREVIAEDKLLLLPDTEKLEEEYRRALKAGEIRSIWIRPGEGSQG